MYSIREQLLTTCPILASLYMEILHTFSILPQKGLIFPNFVFSQTFTPNLPIFYTDISVISVTFCNSPVKTNVGNIRMCLRLRRELTAHWLWSTLRSVHQYCTLLCEFWYIALPLLFALISYNVLQPATTSSLWNPSYESDKRRKVKLVKWCWKKWNGWWT